MARDETNAARLDRDILTADAVDAKSCKAEETEERIRKDGDDRPRQSDADECKRYVGNTRTHNRRFSNQKKAFKRKPSH